MMHMFVSYVKLVFCNVNWLLYYIDMDVLLFVGLHTQLIYPYRTVCVTNDIVVNLCTSHLFKRLV